jgi:hypothetical protein
MNPQAIIDVAHTASTQSDRWLFVALIVIGLFSAFWLFKYFTGRIDVLQKRMDDQSVEFINHLKIANKDMLEVISTAHKTISLNTAMMERVERRLTDSGRRIGDG